MCVHAFQLNDSTWETVGTVKGKTDPTVVRVDAPPLEGSPAARAPV